jgi:ubiquinone biosynthesis protein
MVAVKVQRPGIQAQMKADLSIMLGATRVAARSSEELQAIDLEGMIEQFSESVMAELNLLGEAYNAMRLAENMASIEGVHIPRVYPEWSTSQVLTMEFIEGVKISNIKAMEAAGLERKTVARRGLRAVVKQLLVDGFFHADPHPGNVLVNLQTGRITFIDCGMVGQLSLTERVNVIQLLMALQQGDVAGMGQVLRHLSVPFAENIDEKAYQRDFERVISRQMYVGGSAGFGETVNLGLDLLRSHGLRLDPNLTMAIKALMQAEAFATLLYPEGGIVQEGTEMVQEMALQEITADKVVEVVKGQVMMTAREALKRLPSLQEATMGWLDQYQKGRFEVYVDTSGLDKSVDRIGALGRMIVIATILVGLLIGSAIATSVLAFIEPGGPVWEFTFRLSYLGFVAAMVVAIFIVLRLMWRWIRGKKPLED